MVHTRCMLDKQGYMHARACTCPRARAHARVHSRAHTSTQLCNIYCFSTATMIRERALMLRYTYIVCLLTLAETKRIRKNFREECKL
jgi:hypothetical protein